MFLLQFPITVHKM